MMYCHLYMCICIFAGFHLLIFCPGLLRTMSSDLNISAEEPFQLHGHHGWAVPRLGNLPCQMLVKLEPFCCKEDVLLPVLPYLSL